MSNAIDIILQKFDKFNMSITQVPLYKLQNISNLYNVNLYCLRDDLTGFGFGGNKIRKLDYLIKDAVNQGCDSVVTWGSNQSNWCRMTAAAGSVNGLEVHLLLQGKKPDKATANLKLDQLAGAEIAHIDDDDEAMFQALHQKIKELRAIGKKPYPLVLGGSNPLGSLGYLEVFKEILEFSEKAGISFSKIFHASGSGGTQTGLAMGKIVSHWQGQVIGINVSRPTAEQEEKVWKLLQETGDFLSVKVSRKAVMNDGNYVGKGYRVNTKEAGEAIALFARKEGIFLDEVYSGKAASGMLDYIKKGKINSQENILFIHTGGNVQLFE